MGEGKRFHNAATKDGTQRTTLALDNYAARVTNPPGDVKTTRCLQVMWVRYVKSAIRNHRNQEKGMTESYDEAIEALRKKLNELPRYSFFIDGGGGVVRVADNCGRWIEWQSAHEMFDTEFVDCAIAELRVRRAIAKAQAAPKPHWPVPSAPAVPQWQPIETAPKLAGGRVLILKDCGPGTLSSMSIAFWLDDDRWHLTESTRTAESYGYRVTHWMPLPAAPSPTEKKES